MTILNRKFGVEIEYFGVPYTRVNAALREIGIVCAENAASGWSIHGDGSIQGADSGELVSPPLMGEEGFQEVLKVAKVLSEIGATVNQSCGLHVHVDCDGLTSADLKNLLLRYLDNETAIDNLMPRARRGSSNTYCRPMSQIGRDRIRNAEGTTVREFVSHLVSDRFFKLNVLAYLRHGTVEFRHHSGSTNGEKIVNWIKFCLNFVEKSRVEPVLAPTAMANIPYAELLVDPEFPVDVQRKIKILRVMAHNFQRTRNRRRASLHADNTEMQQQLAMSATVINTVMQELNREQFVFAETASPNVWRLRIQASVQLRDMTGDQIERMIKDRYIESRLTLEQVTLRNNARALQVRAEAAARNAARTSSRAVVSIYEGLPREVVNFYEERAAELAA